MFKELNNDQINKLRKNFWKKVNICKSNNCWNWIGAISKNKYDTYGKIKIPGTRKTARANRVSYFLSTGIDPLNMVVMHSCDNPKCCNPKHLKLGTHKDNMWDMKIKGRARGSGHKNQQGSKNKNSKLTEKDITEIRIRLHKGHTVSSIVKNFPVSASMIYNIKAKKSWTHLT